MNSKFQIDLSSEEIFVLAGLLGHETVFGINEPPTLDWNGDIKKKIKGAVKQLQRKKMIWYDLDGTLFIKDELNECIECICEAYTVALFSTNIKNGKNATAYVLEKNKRITLVERLNNGKYRIQMADDTVISELFPGVVLRSTVGSVKEKMLYEEATFIQEQITSFNDEQANSHLNKCVSEEQTASLLLKIISGNSKYLSIQIHQKNYAIYNTVFNTLIAVPDNNAICVSADENDVINFNSINPNQVYEQIQIQLGLKKGDVV